MSKCEIDGYGHKRWYLNGGLHREDGPAMEWVNGDKEWWLNVYKHRVDGPAVEYVDGDKYWWYHGKKVDCQTNKEFLKLIKLKAFW